MSAAMRRMLSSSEGLMERHLATIGQSSLRLGGRSRCSRLFDRIYREAEWSG